MNSRHFVCSSTTGIKQENKHNTAKYIAEYNTLRKCRSQHPCDTLLIKGEEFEDTKRVIRIRKSKKDRQHNGQKYKRTNNDLQNKHIKKR